MKTYKIAKLPAKGITLFKKAANSIKQRYIPEFEEADLFVLSLSVILLFILNKGMRSEVIGAVSNDFSYWILLLFAIFGIILSIYHAFSKREKKWYEKSAMLFFAMFSNIFIGFAAAVHILFKSKGWMIIFPIINLVNVIIIFFLYRNGHINEKSISEENAKYHQIAIGTILTVLVIFISNSVYKAHWALTLSVCTSIIPALNRAFDNILLNIKSIKGVSI